MGLERQVAELIDDQQLGLGELGLPRPASASPLPAKPNACGHPCSLSSLMPTSCSIDKGQLLRSSGDQFAVSPNT